MTGHNMDGEIMMDVNLAEWRLLQYIKYRYTPDQVIAILKAHESRQLDTSTVHVSDEDESEG